MRFQKLLLGSAFELFEKSFPPWHPPGLWPTPLGAGPFPVRRCISLNSVRSPLGPVALFFNVRAERKSCSFPTALQSAKPASVHEAAHSNIHHNPQRQKHE